MSRLPRVTRAGLRRRALAAAELTGIARLEVRADSLGVAVAENAALATDLEKVVAETERAVLEVMERAEARRVGG